ncbi:OsmC family protein [Aliikangiella sp. IMCC44359]|uniref:OsmC family protein n=1 Tax=Aliikangiella sp. IMCC44359 TaxID=3459125 RepID=UPI00403A9627
MKIVTQWQNDLAFNAITEDGHTVSMDADGKYPSPMQLILMAIGGCSSIDVVMILKRARQNISDCQCEVTAERAESVPKVFTKIHAHYKVTGKELNKSQVERACNLSMEKYCSVSLMLNKAVDISHTIEVIEE